MRLSKTAATCRELLAREAALWTFVRVEGIEPTNNSAKGTCGMPCSGGRRVMARKVSRAVNLLPIS